MLSYLLIGAGIGLLILIFDDASGGGSSAHQVGKRRTRKTDRRAPPFIESKPATPIERVSDLAEKMHEKSPNYRNDAAFDLAYCGWFRKFKILVNSLLETAKFEIDQQGSFKKAPELRAICEKSSGSTLMLERVLNGVGAVSARNLDDREPLLYGGLPPPPQSDDPVAGPRQLVIYQRRLQEHDEYVREIKKEFSENPNICKLFFILIKGLREEAFLTDTLRRHQIDPVPVVTAPLIISVSTVNISAARETRSRIFPEQISNAVAAASALSSHRVRNLIHFTRVDNLQSILHRGIMSVVRMRDEEVHFESNDQERRDLKLDAISLSASFPNQFMFYKYRMGSPNTDWVVFEVSPSALSSPSVDSFAFYRTNAAHHKMRDLEVPMLATKLAVDALFDETELTRAQFLRPCDPTDVQAEIMLFGTIAPSKITRIIFETEEVAGRWSHLTGSYTVAVTGRGRGYFGTRERFLS